MFDGEGEGKIELVCTRLENERDIWRHQKWYTLPGRGYLSHLETKVTRCVFPASGRYRFTLHFDGQLLTERFLKCLIFEDSHERQQSRFCSFSVCHGGKRSSPPGYSVWSLVVIRWGCGSPFSRTLFDRQSEFSAKR
jgi:hypothetical protein